MKASLYSADGAHLLLCGDSRGEIAGPFAHRCTSLKGLSGGLGISAHDVDEPQGSVDEAQEEGAVLREEVYRSPCQRDALLVVSIEGHEHRARGPDGALEDTLGIGSSSVLKPHVDLLVGAAAHEQDHRIVRAQQRVGKQDLVRQGFDPPSKGDELSTRQRGLGGLLDQARRPLEVPRRQGMMDGLRGQPISLVPLAGSAVQGGRKIGIQLLEALPQEVCKEPMVAVPAPLVVKAHDEQVGTLQRLLAAGARASALH